MSTHVFRSLRSSAALLQTRSPSPINVCVIIHQRAVWKLGLKVISQYICYTISRERRCKYVRSSRCKYDRPWRFKCVRPLSFKYVRPISLKYVRSLHFRLTLLVWRCYTWSLVDTCQINGNNYKRFIELWVRWAWFDSEYWDASRKIPTNTFDRLESIHGRF